MSQSGRCMTPIQSPCHLDFHWELFCPIKKFKTAICESCSAKQNWGKEESFQKSINCGLPELSSFSFLQAMPWAHICQPHGAQAAIRCLYMGNNGFIHTIDWPLCGRHICVSFYGVGIPFTQTIGNYVSLAKALREGGRSHQSNNKS